MVVHQFEGKLIVHTCPNEKCGVDFAVTDGYDDRRRADGAAFLCPNGHSLSYKGNTRADILAREKAELEKRLASAIEREKTALRSARATRAQVTKLKKAASHG